MKQALWSMYEDLSQATHELYTEYETITTALNILNDPYDYVVQDERDIPALIVDQKAKARASFAGIPLIKQQIESIEDQIRQMKLPDIKK